MYPYTANIVCMDKLCFNGKTIILYSTALGCAKGQAKEFSFIALDGVHVQYDTIYMVKVHLPGYTGYVGFMVLI